MAFQQEFRPDPLFAFTQRKASELVQRLQYALRQSGIDSSISFYAGPDLSLSSNFARTNDGFVYGGVLMWRANRAVAFPGLRPNGCGVLLSRIGRRLDKRQLTDRIVKAKTKDGVSWDYGNSNHYIGIYRDTIGIYYGLLHGGTAVGKLRDRPQDSLYPEINPEVLSEARIEETPFGQVTVLLDSAALSYYKNFKRIEVLIKRRREKLCRYLWPDGKIVFHATHQGLAEPSTAVLGGYLLRRFERRQAVPIMVGLGESLLTMAGGFPVSAMTGFSTGETKSPVREKFNAWFVPHGSGDTNHKIKAIDVHPDYRFLTKATMKNGSSTIYSSVVPTPDHRSEMSFRRFCVRDEYTAVGVFTHVITFKI